MHRSRGQSQSRFLAVALPFLHTGAGRIGHVTHVLESRLTFTFSPIFLPFAPQPPLPVVIGIEGIASDIVSFEKNKQKQLVIVFLTKS